MLSKLWNFIVWNTLYWPPLIVLSRLSYVLHSELHPHQHKTEGCGTGYGLMILNQFHNSKPAKYITLTWLLWLAKDKMKNLFLSHSLSNLNTTKDDHLKSFWATPTHLWLSILFFWYILKIFSVHNARHG